MMEKAAKIAAFLFSQIMSGYLCWLQKSYFTMLPDKELIRLLNLKAEFYNQPSFIINDPISIPHLFTKKEDIEIAGFITAMISWGRREQIIKTGTKIMQLMGNRPHDFITNEDSANFQKFESFYYRTLSGDDMNFLLYA